METHSVFEPRAAISALGETGPWYHFSVDDVFDSLIEVTDKGIPLFEHKEFKLFKELHDLYGINVGLNLFFQKEISGKLRSLCDVRDLRNELNEAGNWIKFGPHALDFANAPHTQTPAIQMEVFNKTYSEIDRFAGKENRIKWTRLHYYSESYELANFFKEKGVTALFSTDRAVGSHRMPDTIKLALSEIGHASYQDMNFIRTQFRVEFFVDEKYSEQSLEKLFSEMLEKCGYIILYTHEYEFEREEIRAMLRTASKVLHSLHIRSISNL